MKRWDLINYLIEKFNYKTYLEIGVDSGTCFSNVIVIDKVSVDPAIEYSWAQPTFKMTSDEFFANNNLKFDIIFIDGNHDKKYVLEDAVLCFKKLKLGGWMIFDDMQCKEVSDAVHAFLTIYSQYFEVFKIDNAQLFIKRKIE